MITLNKLIEDQKITGESDLAIIRKYFVLNNIEEQGMDLVYDLAKDKIEKMRNRLSTINTWAYTIPSDWLYKNYDVDIATMLHDIELNYIISGAVTSKYLLDWARENIPNIEKPKVYFVPCMEYLESIGIKFKESVS